MKNINSIWTLHNSLGFVNKIQVELEREAIIQFWNIFTSGWSDIEEKMELLSHYLIFFLKEVGMVVGREVTLKEVESILKKLARDKSSGPNGWTIEFFS